MMAGVVDENEISVSVQEEFSFTIENLSAGSDPIFNWEQKTIKTSIDQIAKGLNTYVTSFYIIMFHFYSISLAVHS